MDQPSQRYKNLIEELGREMEHRRGWKTEVARRFGVHQSTITRALKGVREEVSAESVRLAAKGLGISESYFYDDEEPSTYREHQDALFDLFPTESERALLDVLELAQALFATYVAKGRLPAQASDLAARVLALDFVERARLVTVAPATASAHRTVELVKTLGGMSVSLKALQRASALEHAVAEESARLG